MHVVCANIFGANVLKSRFKIDVVIMIRKKERKKEYLFISFVRYIDIGKHTA